MMEQNEKQGKKSMHIFYTLLLLFLSALLFSRVQLTLFEWGDKMYGSISNNNILALKQQQKQRHR